MANKATNKRTSSKRSSSQSSNQRKRAVSPAEKSGRRQPAVAATARQPILDNGTHRTIAGILCAIVALALVLIVAWPTNAVVTSFLSQAMRMSLGAGAYLLPVLLVIVAFLFVSRFESRNTPTRIIIGMTIMFVSFLVLLALFTPGAVSDAGVTDALLSVSQVIYRGGYLGAGPAWVLLTFLGLPVSCVIVVGFMFIGLAVIGFSISSLFRVIAARRAERQARIDEELASAPDVPFIPAIPARASAQAGVDNTARTQSFGDTDIEPRANTRPISERIEGGRSMPVGGGATQSLTRKLGKRQSEETEKKKSKSSTPTEKLDDVAVVTSVTPDDSFELPSPTLLKTGVAKKKSKAIESELAETAGRLQQTMADFGIMATVVDWIAGPTVTLFEVDLPPGVRVSRIMALNDDIALALAAPGVRIFAPIPGTHYVGIEVPNATRENVLLGDVLKEVHGGPLEMAIGKDVEGNAIVCDLAKMPHLLIGGTTGSGKSVGINAMIMSMLMRATPSQVRFIMIDPKRVEFTPYNGIPHLYVPVVTEPKEAASALSWGVAEMERRLKVFSKVGARNIAQYNEKVRTGELGEGDTAATDELPYIVIIIDELADLMMNVGKEVEFSISRIAQLARAAGIHLIVATQRPSANVVTGLIKANITNRMAFNVASGLDSRVILDVSGAESLIGNGDLLLSKPEYAKPVRIQGCFVSPEEISSVVDAVKAQGEPEYHSEILKTNIITLGDTMPDGSGGTGSSDDPLIWEAADIVVASGMGSTSNIQRKLKVGYSRAGRIMDMLEEKGVVGAPNGSKPREVLVDAMELETLKAFEQADGQ